MIMGSTLKNAFKYLIIFCPVIFLVTLIVYLKDINLKLQQIKTSETNQLTVITTAIKNRIIATTSDLSILSRNNYLKQYFRNRSASNRKNIEQLFSLVMDETNLYDQIRLIDRDGQEIVRVNFINQSPHTTPLSKLQNKKSRYYFKDTIKLPDRGVFISPLDLNVENSKIEVPWKPMIRLATPVFYDGNSNGILIINYYGSEIINAIKNLHSDIESNNKDSFCPNYTYFLNSDSYYFNNTDSSKNWGFMFPEKKSVNFKTDFPNEWKIISGASQGQLNTGNGVFTFQTVHPAREAWQASSGTANPVGDSDKILSGREYEWKLVNYIPKTEINRIIIRIALRYLIIFLVSFIIILIVSLILSSSEIKRKKIQKEIEQTIESLNISNNTKNRFFSIISHDLKGPIGSVNGLLSIIHEDWDNTSDEEKKESIETLCQASQYLTDLLNNLLLWSRSQMNKIEVNKDNVNVKEIVQRSVSLYDHVAAEKNITLSDKIPDGLSVYADYNLLDTVIRNLINNAIKFTRDSGEIIIYSEDTAEKTIIKIKDNGVGISQENLNKLFKIDASYHTKGTNNERGTGLGLILCKEFIELNGGKLSVYSEVGKGSTFSIELKK